MLKPIKMQYVRIIGLKAVEPEVLSVLQKAGMLHITPSKNNGLEQGKPLADFETVSAQLVRMRAIKAAMPQQREQTAPIVVKDAVSQAASLKIDEEIVRLKVERDDLAKKITENDKLVANAARLANLEVDMSAIPSSLDYAIYSVKNEKAGEFGRNVEAKAKHVQWASAQDADDEKRTIFLAAMPKGSASTIEIDPAVAEKIEWAGKGVPKRAHARAKFLQADYQDALKQNQGKIQALSRQYYHLVSALEEELSIEADRAEIANRFGESRECFYISGWAKKSELDRIESILEGKFGKKAIVQHERAHWHGRQIVGQPTVLENPKVAGPFQYLVEMLSLPQPDEIDPTMLLAFFLPVIYGMIVGDAGYALISLALAFALIKISAPGGMLRQFASMWALCAAPAFVFGVLFDEYFGFSHKALLGLKEPLYEAVVHRVENVQMLLLLSIFVGLGHVAFGFILGFINEWGHSKKHAAVKLGWLAVEIGGVLAVGGFMLDAFDAQTATYGAGLLGLGALTIVWGEGVVGIFEIPGLASNIMSYARIAAVGVAGVILAEIINEMLLPDPKMLSTPIGIATFVFISIIYVAFHVFNTFIAMFESLIHGARLNVIEFYGKFYKGNGIRFVPFAAKRRLTVCEE